MTCAWLHPFNGVLCYVSWLHNVKIF